MTAFSVTFERESPLDDLIIGAPSPSSAYWVPEEGTSWPRLARRKVRAPASPHLDGPGALLARLADGGPFPFAFYAGGATDEDVWAAQEAMQETVDQWAYDLTLTVGSASRVFRAECVDDEIEWGEIDSGMVRARIVRGSVSIPLLRRL